MKCVGVVVWFVVGLLVRFLALSWLAVFWQIRASSIAAKPSLQSLRAGTLVERFTARMHVYSVLCFAGVPRDFYG